MPDHHQLDAPASTTHVGAESQELVSKEIAANFALGRVALCKPEYMDERMRLRLMRRLRKSAHLPVPIVIKNFFSNGEIGQIYSFVQEVKDGINRGDGIQESAAAADDGKLPGEAQDSVEEDSMCENVDEDDAPEPGSEEWLAEQMRLSARLHSSHFDLDQDAASEDDNGEGGEPNRAPAWVHCSQSHQKLFLHHDAGCSLATGRTFAQACPELMAKLLETMHASPLADALWRSADSDRVERPPLFVRCVEFHDYQTGAGLIDPGHIDVGSTITLSVQLSDPGPTERGGRFTTTDASGCATAHELAQGDAIIFCSETVHNVSTLHDGTRNSLVLELWTDPANRVDRHH